MTWVVTDRALTGSRIVQWASNGNILEPKCRMCRALFSRGIDMVLCGPRGGLIHLDCAKKYGMVENIKPWSPAPAPTGRQDEE